MTKPNALSVAVEMATRQRDEARRVLQHAQGAQRAAQDQLQVLQGYAQETESRWGMRAQATVAPEVMFHHYHFMGRLDHAAGLQSGVVDDHAQRVALAQQQLRDAEVRLASLRKLLEKRQMEALQAQARRDQKMTDERAALRHRSSAHGH
ncbi:flagellar export protein FliJ [Simplicispira sedimenti]|uniref:flagellar export protein FliJ n=1 Tax=Simplicispira sedimenti TaxID=2919500 RepID=UPI001FA97D34|nr:flagellar export protein FliJ [Acidovorax sp. W1-6]